MAKSISYIGLDVHKDTIAVALAEASLGGEVRERGIGITAFSVDLPAWGTIVPWSLRR